MARPAKPWKLPESEVTEESYYLNRRRFIAGMGIGGIAAIGLAKTLRKFRLGDLNRGDSLSPVRVHPDHQNPNRPLSRERNVLTHNNFYEFSTQKNEVYRLARGFVLEPYTLTIDGLVDPPLTLDMDRIEALGLEERIYRFRCVEAWAMTVPWIGVPLSKIFSLCNPRSSAKFLALQSFHDPEQAPGQSGATPFPWPYYEALRLDEAFHDLAFVAIGLYGRRLAPQNGTPLRVVLPWKYGFKGPKSVVRMTLTAQRPPTFWNDLFPREYGFLGNVDPSVPHPRWSQSHERLVGSGRRVPTLLYNGYATSVGDLYQ